jgi:hypothetical protein
MATPRGVRGAGAIYELLGNESELAWHENRDPGTHAPELFCLDLCKELDIPTLAALAAPTPVR